MPRTNKDVVTTYNLTPRDFEIAVKGLVTMVDNNQKPNFDKLSKSANFKDAMAAQKAWWALRKKLQATGNDNTAAAAAATEGPKGTKRKAPPTGTDKQPAKRRVSAAKMKRKVVPAESSGDDDGDEDDVAKDSDGPLGPQWYV